MVSSINTNVFQPGTQPSGSAQQNQNNQNRVGEAQQNSEAIAKSQIEPIAQNTAETSRSEEQLQDQTNANQSQLENNPTAQRGELIDIAV